MENKYIIQNHITFIESCLEFIKLINYTIISERERLNYTIIRERERG